MALENRKVQHSSREPAKSGHETVLVVEDNDLVLELVVEMMNDLGYVVLTAMNARAALWILGHNDGIELLFTDVMMPDGMNGIDLARTARQARPDLKVLLTSGYPGANRGVNEFPMLPKPYRRAELARRLRAVLDAA